MKKQTVVLVDAFTDRAFSGNQAAVCFFKTRGKFTVEQMQLIAAELNLSETCFVFPVEENLFSLRWFTPTVEVPLCGHATLAAAHVIFEKQKTAPKSQVKHKVVRFQTQTKGELVVRKDDKRKGFMMMDFPVGKPEQQKVTEPILEALQKALSLAPGAITELWQCNFTRKLLVIVNSPDAVKGVKCNGDALQAISFPADWTVKGVVVTAKSAEGSSYDFISRYFAPFLGILEDPVTGTAHCALAPFWCLRLNRISLTGYQASARGGIVGVELKGDRVQLSGEAITILKGKMKF